MAAAQRAMDRKKREDDSPRLKDLIPKLATLQIGVVEFAGTNTTKHKRHVVIARAAALFEVPCADKDCQEGGHDITHDVMRALKQGQTVATGEHACEGNVGSARCTRHIQFEVTATYA